MTNTTTPADDQRTQLNQAAAAAAASHAAMLAQLRSTLTQVLQVGVAYRQITHQLATGEVTGGVEAHAITIPAAALDRVQGYLAAVADELAAAPVTELAQSQPLANGRLDDNVPSQEPSPTPERTPAEDTCQ